MNLHDPAEEIVALRAEIEQFRLLANNVPVAIAYFERQGFTCRYANLGYASMFGRDEQNILGLTFAQIIGEAAAQQIQPQALRVLSSDEARRADAASLPLECLQAGLFDDAQAAVLRQLAQKILPEGSWKLEDATDPERPDVRGKRFRLPVVDDALRARLEELKPGLGGVALVACK